MAIKAAAPEDYTLLQRALILLSATMATTLYATTILVVSVILPQMQGSLSATQDQIAWVVTFNILATAVATPMTGWLASTFGRRRTMIYAQAGFMFSTLACALAPNLELLVIARIFQGAFGAPLVPLAQATILDSFDISNLSKVCAISRSPRIVPSSRNRLFQNKCNAPGMRPPLFE